MTLSLSGQEPKSELLDLIRRLLQSIIFPHLRMDQRENIIEHFAWMKRQRDDLKVNCKLETVPELRLTRIVIEVGFKDIPPMEAGS